MVTKRLRLCCAGSFDATVRIWDCKSQSTKPIQVLEDSGDSVSSLDVLGHEIVTGSVDGKMRLYDLRMGMIYADVVGRKKSRYNGHLFRSLTTTSLGQNLSLRSSKLETEMPS